MAGSMRPEAEYPERGFTAGTVRKQKKKDSKREVIEV